MSFTLLDGGMGQELMRRSGRSATPLWSADIIRERPDLVEDAHADFLAAGADVITLASYSVTPSRLAQSGREDEFGALQQAAAAAAGRARLRVKPGARIAGCIPPLPGSYRPEDRSGGDAMRREYEGIVRAQMDAVDLFLCETLASVEEARLATRSAVAAGRPVWTALTVDEADGRVLRSGEPLVEAADAAVAEGAEAVLVNCSPPEVTGTALGSLLGRYPVVGAYANAFTSVAALKVTGTVDALEALDDLDAVSYADAVMAWAQAGATILGGCCEITPAHIAEIERRRIAGAAQQA